MTKLYVATRVITFFGTILRALWEQVVCRICKIPIEDVRAFKSSELCGHVEHELLETPTQVFLMNWFPITMNFTLGSLMLMTASYKLFYIGSYEEFQPYVLLWLGISLLANCAPSFEDMLTFKDVIYGGKNLALKIILAPLFAISCFSACLEKYSLTFIISILYAFVYPYVCNVFFPLFENIKEMIV